MMDLDCSNSATPFPLIPSKRGGALVQSLLKQISKEMGIMVPTLLVIQGNDEQVGVF